jgi:uncharacterized protein
MKKTAKMKSKASSQGKFVNSGNGFFLQTIDIEHPKYIAVIQPDTAFWCLVKKNYPADVLHKKKIVSKLKKYFPAMSKEMQTLRFGLKPSAVYFNPTEKCNLNCPYCYIPEKKRKNGINMSWANMKKSLDILKNYFKKSVPAGRKPQLVFHGSEPLINKKNVFKAIEKYSNDFEFGIQTNGTLFEKEDFNFISSHNVVVGLSIDGHIAEVSDRTRKNWNSDGTFKKLIEVLNLFKRYPLFSVICTVTTQNVRNLVKIIDFLHNHKIENCLLNQVRCTLKGGRTLKPHDGLMAKMFIKALDRSYELFQKTGRKLVIGNFANILLSIIAPSARRLMCDISPCGGGRCFFAVSAKGNVFPCSEFIGLPRFKGGNLFKDNISKILKSKPFLMVTGRQVENIEPCQRCAIQHFCGAPCPAESYQIHGEMESPGAFCEFYEHQVRYAFRLIADKKERAYLWNNWDKDTKDVLKF